MVSNVSKKSVPLASKLALWAPRGIVFLLALSLTGSPGVTASPPGATYVCAGVALAVASILFWSQGLKARPWMSILSLSLFAWTLLSVIGSPSVYLSSMSLASLAGLTAAILTLELCTSSKERWRETGTLICVVATCSAIHGIYQWKSFHPPQALHSTFTNPDCYSLIPAIGFFLALAFTLESSGLRRVLFGGAALLLFFTIVLTGSRAGLLGAGVGYSGVLVTLLASRSERLRKAALGLFMVPSLLLLLLLLSGTQTLIMERFVRLGRGDDPVAIKSRWDVLRYSLKCIADKPLLGNGAGCFHLAYQKVRPALVPGEVYMNVAHNDYIQWAVETGLPGLALWLSLLLLAILGSWRSYRSPTPWVACQIGTTLAISTYTALNFACPVPADLLWIGASLGLSGALMRSKRSESEDPWNPRVFPVVAFLLAASVWTVYWGTITLASAKAEQRAEQAATELAWEQAVEVLKPALRRQPDNFRLQLRLASLAKRAFVLTGEPSWLKSQQEALLDAYRANPQDPQTLLSLVLFYQEQFQPDQAAPYLEQAQAQAPYSVEVRRAAARSLVLLGKFNEATTSLSELDRTGISVDDAALADLIYLLETRSSGKGSLILRKVGAENPERCADLALKAASVAQHRKDFKTALSLLKQARYVSTNRPDLAWEIARTRSLAGQTEMELAILDKLRRDPIVESDDEVLQKVWKRWAELAARKGLLDLVIAQLEDYLIVHRRQNWARQTLSEVYLKRGLKAEARTALRTGLSYDEDGSLRVQLADLCASQGLTTLARGYYREALTLSADPKAIEARLNLLKENQDALDELDDEPGTKETP